MQVKQRILDDLKAALKSGDRLRLEVLRSVKARMLEAEVKRRGEAGRQATLDEAAVEAVIAAGAKQRRESIDSYRQAQRADLVAAEEAELAILLQYLPAPMSAAEIAAVVEQAVEESGASSPRDMGAVMKLALSRIGTRADGKEISRLVREALATL